MIKNFLSIIIIFGACFLSFNTYLNYKKKIFNLINLFCWCFIWFFLVLISIRPKNLDYYIQNNYEVSIFYLISIIFSFFCLVCIYFIILKIKYIDQKLNNIIIKQAYTDYKKNNLISKK